MAAPEAGSPGAEILESGTAMDERSIVWPNTPRILPLRRGFLASPYGWRDDPFTGKKVHHSGIDFSAWYGEETFATADGIVLRTGESPYAGKFVEIHHGFGYSTRYAHLLEFKVRPGQLVRRNTVIGLVARSTSWPSSKKPRAARAIRRVAGGISSSPARVGKRSFRMTGNRR